MIRVVVPDDCPPVLALSASYATLRASVQLEYFDTLPGSEPRLIERVRDADAVLNIRSSSKFSEAVLRSCSRLRLLSLWGTGTDNVDLAAAARYGITVTNTPGVSAASVAEHALALLLAAARGIPAQDGAVREGEWPRGHGVELYGKTLGIVGLGAIGRRFAQLGRGIGMQVIAWTLHPNPALGFDLVELDQLLRVSDVISLHVRLSPQTEGLIAAREFALMKPNTILVNTARGAVVDESALVEALSTNRIKAAALDVFTREPLPPRHPLTKLSNVVLTPHAAGITPEALESGLQLAVMNVLNFIQGKPTNRVQSAP